MMEKFYPDEYLDSTYEIDFDELYAQGYRGVIFDIDNTLVRHGAPADERACALFAHLKELGFACMLLSNNKEPRVKHHICRRSDIYGYIWCEACRYPLDSGKTDSSERGDTDCIKKISGKDRAVFLQKRSGKEKQRKTIDGILWANRLS